MKKLNYLTYRTLDFIGCQMVYSANRLNPVDTRLSQFFRDQITDWGVLLTSYAYDVFYKNSK